MFHDCFNSVHMTYMHVRKEKGLNIQFSKAGEMRLGVCGSGKTKGGKEG